VKRATSVAFPLGSADVELIRRTTITVRSTRSLKQHAKKPAGTKAADDARLPVAKTPREREGGWSGEGVKGNPRESIGAIGHAAQIFVPKWAGALRVRAEATISHSAEATCEGRILESGRPRNWAMRRPVDVNQWYSREIVSV
jgi:hypothetical protein